MRFFFIRDLVKAASFFAFLVAGPVQADDQLMTLFPKQRASHQEQVDVYAGHYQERGQAYVDHLYATGGEEPMEPDTLIGELKDESIDTVPVDTGEVADLVKQAEDDGLISEDGSSPSSVGEVPVEGSVKEGIPPRSGAPVPVGEPKGSGVSESSDSKETGASPATSQDGSSQDIVSVPSPSSAVPDPQSGLGAEKGKEKEGDKGADASALPTPSVDGAVPVTDLVVPPTSSAESPVKKP